MFLCLLLCLLRVLGGTVVGGAVEGLLVCVACAFVVVVAFVSVSCVVCVIEFVGCCLFYVCCWL